MWSNCMRFVGEQGVPAAELGRLARTPTNLNGMQRWGYIVVEPDPADSRPKPPRSAWLIRATSKGRQLRRYGDRSLKPSRSAGRRASAKNEIDQLRESLGAMISRIDIELPDCLSLLALLSRVLLAFAIEFERESELSLAIGANVVRVLDEKGLRVRDLPLLTGVSKEAISMALGFLRKRQMAVVEPDQTGSRTKVVRLTRKGREAQDAYHRLLGVIEARWHERFGEVAIRALRESLERLTGEPSARLSPLFQGLTPYPDRWRAVGPQAQHTAALSHGAASRRVPRRKLTPA